MAMRGLSETAVLREVISLAAADGQIMVRGPDRWIFGSAKSIRVIRTRSRTRGEFPRENAGFRGVRIPASRSHKSSRIPIEQKLTLAVSERFERFRRSS
jgi:hypothetical protein